MMCVWVCVYHAVTLVIYVNNVKVIFKAPVKTNNNNYLVSFYKYLRTCTYIYIYKDPNPFLETLFAK